MFTVLLTSVHDVIAIQEKFTLIVISPWVLSATESTLSLFLLDTRLRRSVFVMAPTSRLGASTWPILDPAL